MSCNGICGIANDAICMNLCTLKLDSKRWYLLERGDSCYLKHPDLKWPAAKVLLNDDGKINELKKYISQQKAINTIKTNVKTR